MAGNADILVLNHSLLVANAAIDKGFLPQLSYLIIDEAQHLEHAAEEQLSAKVDIYEILSVISRIKRREKGKAAGALAVLAKFSASIKNQSMVGQFGSIACMN